MNINSRVNVVVDRVVNETLACVTNKTNLCTDLDGSLVSAIYATLIQYQQHVNIMCYTVCASNPCQNDGFCSVDSTDRNQFICDCVAGYSGDTCSDGVFQLMANKMTNERICINSMSAKLS